MFKYIQFTLKLLAIGMLFFIYPDVAISQTLNTSAFDSPLKIPLYLSGNYGELRSTHFHAGIDLKTQGKTGQPVYSAKEGYISRIKIQSGGYGHSIYITHPDGYKTVYAHLDRFNPEIHEFVKQNQYNLQRFEINLYPPKNKFKLEKGQQFAYSGNTGRSGGPHLHFEVRDASNDVPLNALKFNFPVEDNVPPEFRNLYAYSFPENNPAGNNGEERRSYQATRKNDTLFFINDIVELQQEYIGFGTEVYDFLNGSTNRCGIYSLEFSIDDVSLFSFTIDAISFLKTRYINAHMDYDLKISEGRSVHRLFKLPNNQLSIYNKNIYTSLYHITDDSLHNGKITSADTYGNRSCLEFRFRIVNTNLPKENKGNKDLVKWNEGKEFVKKKCTVRIPGGALYRDIFFDYSVIPSISSFSDTICIHYDTEPLHKNITIKITPDTIPGNRVSKLFIARKNGDGISCEGGEWLNNQLVTDTRKFGKYFVAIDTVPPDIVPVNFNRNGDYSDGQSLIFKVTDDLSGIESYNAYIDNHWVLLEYDEKNDIMFYKIDMERLNWGINHLLRLQVSDRKNNVAIFEDQFFY